MDPSVLAGLCSAAGHRGDEVVAELISVFVASTTDRLDRLRAAHVAGDVSAVADLCHSLRGAAATLGAAEASEAAAGLGRACRHGGRDRSTRLAEVEESFARAVGELVARPAA